MTTPAKRLRTGEANAGTPMMPLRHHQLIAETPRNVEEVAHLETPRASSSSVTEGGDLSMSVEGKGVPFSNASTHAMGTVMSAANQAVTGKAAHARSVNGNDNSLATTAARNNRGGTSPPSSLEPASSASTSSNATIAVNAVMRDKQMASSVVGNDESQRGANVQQPQQPQPQQALRRGNNTTGGHNPFEKWDVGSRYKLIKILGRGSYGEVCEGQDLQTNTHVAIKRIHNVFDLEIDTKRIVREVSILRQLKNEHIVRLLDIIPPKTPDFNELYLVFEFVETDLHKLILTPQYLSIDHVRYLLYQLLCAVKYIHSASVIHRDIKPANILLNEDCSLKLCDFGLSRVIRETSRQLKTNNDSPREAQRERLERGGTEDGAGVENPGDGSGSTGASSSSSSSNSSSGAPGRQSLQRQLTKHVVTRWYRPPELILLQEYSTPVDVWSIGCIFAELLSMQKDSVPVFSDRVPLFPGRSCFPLSADNDRSYKDQLDQLNVIFDVIGTPSEEDTAHLGEVRHYLRGLPKKPPKNLAKMYPAATSEAVDLLAKMLVFNPDRRITVQAALAHPFLAGMRSMKREVDAEKLIVFYDDMTMRELREKLLEEIAIYNGGVSYASEISGAGGGSTTTATPSSQGGNDSSSSSSIGDGDGDDVNKRSVPGAPLSRGYSVTPGF